MRPDFDAAAVDWCSNRLIEILQPSGDGLIAVLEAYFDESERKTGTFCVAGLGFAPAAARKLSKKILRLLEGRVFHATDFFQLRGDFADYTEARRDFVLRELVSAITRRFSVAVAINCNINEINSLAPEQLRSREHAYAMGVHGCMLKLGDWVHRVLPRTSVAYVFEAGHEGLASANLFASVFAHDPRGSAEFAYRSHTFQPKQDSPLLQAADWFAWEWAKHFAESVETKVREPRKSLVAMAQGRRDQFVYAHVTGQNLVTAIKQYEDIWKPWKDKTRRSDDD